MVQFSVRTMQGDLEAASGRPTPLIVQSPAKAPLAPPATLKISPPPAPEKIAPAPTLVPSPKILTPLKPTLPSAPPIPTAPRLPPKPALTPLPAKPQPKLTPPKPPSPHQEILTLFQKAKTLFDQQIFEEAIKKFEAILLLKPSWWEKQKIKNYIGRGQKKILAIEYAKQEAQKKLEEKFKKEQKTKLKAAKELEIKSRELEQARQKRLAEEKRLREKQEFLEKETKEETRTAAELTLLQTEAEKQARQITEEKQQQLKLKEEELRILTATKKIEEERSRLEREKKEIYEKITAATPKFSEEEAQKRLTAEKEALEKKTIEQIRLTAELAKLKEKAALQAPVAEPLRPPAIPTMPPRPPRTLPIAVPPAALPVSRPPLPSKLVLRPTIILGSILTILILGAGLIYWSNYQKSKQPPAPPITPIEEKPLAPAKPFFKIEVTETIIVKKDEENKLLGLLDEIKEKPLKEGSFKHVLIKRINGQEKYLDLKTLVKFFPSGLPAKTLENLTDQYTFFLYGQRDLPSDPFLASLGRNRFGLIVKIKAPDEIPSLMLNWENILTSGPLYKQSKLLSPSASFEPKKFETAIYKDTPIRYLNLPTKYSSIDYAILGDQLLIATSQESMQALVDRLK